MTVVALSALLGVIVALVRPPLAKTILLAWLVLYTVVIAPKLMMPGAEGPVGGSTTYGLALLPIALGAGWLIGWSVSKLTRKRIL